MMGSVARVCSGVLAVGILTTVTSALTASDDRQARQSRPAPIPARNGDVITIDGDDKVSVIRRRQAQVITLYESAARRLLVMIDYPGSSGQPDGGVNATYRFFEVAEWPFGERWSGEVVVEEYTLAGEIGGVALGLVTDRGLIQMLNGGLRSPFHNPSAHAVIPVMGTGRMIANNESFAITEERLMEQERRAQQLRGTVPGSPGRPPLDYQFTMNPPPPPAASAAPVPGQPAPIRVGGTVSKPAQIVHVDAVKPARAVQAGIAGMVIIEATIGTDGSVTDARVLRSIPLLDEAAVAAVKQWRFTPTFLNGVPVPIVMTLTVNFQ